MRFFRFGSLFLLFLLSSAVAKADRIIYVNQGNTNPLQTGSSWATAYTSLQTAISEANPSSSNKVEIWIARGTYMPTSGTDRNASFQMKSHLRLLGGFAGNETSDLTRDIFGNVTILSGDIGTPQRVGTRIRHDSLNNYFVTFDETDPGFSDNSYNVVTCRGVNDVVLEGLFIANGNANYGVTNLLTLDTNLTASYIEDMSHASSVTNTSGETLTPLDNRVAGGAIFITNSYARPNGEVTLTLNECVFLNNGARGYGGAIAAREALIRGSTCLFQNNHAGEAGGAHWGLNQEAHYLGTTFSGNTARVLGGAVVLGSIPTDKMAFSSCADPADNTSLDADERRRLVSRSYSQMNAVLDLEDNATKLATLAQKISNWYNNVPGEATTFGGAASTGLSVAYAALNVAVVIGDLATAGKDDSNDADLRRWRTFSNGFGMYATPAGWISLFSDALVSQLPQQPNYPAAARLIKKAALCAYNSSTSFGQPSYSTFRICNFSVNSSGASGGALACLTDNLQIEDCRFEGNRTRYNGGAIHAGSFTTPIILSSVFYQNYATNGHSAISSLLDARTQIINCSIVENTSGSTNGYAVGVELGSEVQVANSILWGNRNPLPINANGGADVFAATAASLDPTSRTNYDNAGGTYYEWVGICDISYSCVQSLQRLPEGTDIINLFPQARTYSPDEINAILAEKAKAEEFGSLISFGFINVGEGIRPGVRTSRHNIDLNPQLVNGYTPSFFSPVVDAGSTNRFNNGRTGINLLTGVDVTVTNRIVGRSVDMGAIENQGTFATGDIIYVSSTAQGDNSGRDWANAKTSLAEAMRIPNVEIWVAKGTYKPGTSRTDAFSLAKGTKVYGGFDTWMTALNQRDWTNNVTILSGNIGNESSDADNCDNVITVYNVDTTASLDGLTITSGRGSLGAGIYCVNASPSIRNCRFVDNRAASSGGAIYSSGSPGPSLKNCVFQSNSAANSGGALYYENGAMDLSACRFERNMSSGGGAITIRNGTQSELLNCLFVSNSISGGLNSFGGAIWCQNNDLSLIHCTFAYNVATLNSGGTRGGGALEVQGTSSMLTVENSIFWKNSVSNSGGNADTTERQQITLNGNRTINRTSIEGLNAFSAAGTGNSNSDPLFANEASGDFRLQLFSPAIDSGSGFYSATDLAGLPRVKNNVPDRGAYEFQDSAFDSTADFNIIRNCDEFGGISSFIAKTNIANAVYQWQLDANDGRGFRNLTNDTIYSGVTTTNLVITHPPKAANGYHYRLHADNLTTNFESTQIALQVRFSRLFVRAGANPDGDGSSWADAFPTLRQALDTTETCSEIWVAAGTYRPNLTGNTNDALRFRSSVAIYGGFSGTETNLSQRDWHANVTVITANLGTATNNSIFRNLGDLPGQACDSSAVLDGFVLTGATDTAIVATYSSPTIRNCVFTGNDGNIGGGIYLERSSSLISSCIFSNNNAHGGGGLFAHTSTPTVVNSLFHHNGAQEGAGAKFYQSMATVLNSTFTENTAITRGGGITTFGGTNSILNCVLWNNNQRPLYDTASAQLYIDADATTVLNTCWQGVDNNPNGNIAFDPLFIAPTTGDFRLSSFSPCVNAGGNSFANNVSGDLLGNTRIFNGTVDMGAYEFQSATTSPVHILLLPSSVLSCTVAGGTSFSVMLTEDPASVEWQINTGSTFSTVTTNATYSISTSNNSATLSINALTTAMAGHQFRFVLGSLGYTSAPVSLDVHEPSVIYVRGGASGSQDGTSWANAFTNLQDAIQVADQCSMVWVAEGTYIPKRAHGADYYSMRSGLPIYGGFAGTENDLSERHWMEHPTILLNMGTDNPVFWNIGSGGYTSIDNSAILDGFRIRSTNQAIAAIMNDSCQGTIRNCVFENNSRYSILNSRANGVISNCFFTNNFFATVGNSFSSPQIIDCLFTTNQSAFTAAAMYNSRQSSPLVDHCVFENNRGTQGAVYNEETGSPIFSRCVFRSNVGLNGAGAIRNISSNTTLIVNSSFINNASQHIGGAIEHMGQSLRIINSTIADNSAKVDGGGIYLYSGTAEILNSIFWDNRLETVYGIPSVENIQLRKATAATFSVTNSCVQGLQAYTGNDNIGYDPIFVNVTNGDYALQNSSPCVDHGGNQYNSDALDLAGQARILGGGIDIGAYEFQGVPVTPPFILQNPMPQTACLGDTATFTFIPKSNTVGDFQWQVDQGSGFVNITPDATNVIVVNGDITTLSIQNVTPSFDGYRYRLTAPTIPYSTPPASLHVGQFATLYVNRAATNGANNGTNWINAFTNLQSALTAAAAGGCKDIWVASGTYSPTAAPDGKMSFRLGSRIGLYGGFAGGETSLSQRSWTNQVTILQAVPGTSVIECDSSYRAADTTTILDGFIVQGADQPAMNNYNASPTIRNCMFRNNSGAAIQNSTFANPSISDCVFSNNLNSAILNSDQSSPTIEHCRFFNNSSSQSGGAISSIGQSSPVILSCMFSDNAAAEGGAVGFTDAPLAKVINSVFYDNNAGYRGGAIASANSTVQIVNCTIVNNVAGIYGGGLSLQGNYSVKNSILWGNREDRASQSLFAAQVSLDNESVGTLANSIVQGATGITNGISGYDPLFVTASGDFHLTSYSPALNVGLNADINGFLADVEGSNRVVNSTVDLGAYEFQSTAATSPALLTTTPQSVTSCSSLAEVSFDANGNGTSSAIWEISTGGGDFSSLAITGNYSVTTNDKSSRLTVSAVSPSMSGNRFRIRLDSGFVSQPATLTVIQPHVIYVKQNATGTGDGSNWTNAFTNLHAALSSSIDSCSEVWVAAGIYTTEGQSFVMKPNLPILGGFSGTETLAADRNWTNFPTVLQNDGNVSVINNNGIQIDRTAELNGFIIRSTNSAVAIYNLNCSPTIRNCTFDNIQGIALWNNLSSGAILDCVFTNGHTTAVYNRDSSSEFSRCSFVNNSALESGGGAMANSDSSPVVTDCLFQGNKSMNGTGIYNQGESSPVVLRSVFRSNSGTSGGTFSDFGTGTPLVESCLFEGNTSDHLAAAIEHGSSILRIVNCTITGNISRRGSAGLYNSSGTAYVLNSIFWNNKVQETPTGLTIEKMQAIASEGQIVVSNSCVQGLSLYAGNSNTAFDPLFTDSGNNNYSLDPASPSIDAGNSTWLTGTLDLAKASRVFGAGVDLGAYELQSPKTATVSLISAPTAQNVCVGDSATFTVSISADSTNTFQWQLDSGSGFTNVFGGGEHSISVTSTGTVLTANNVVSEMTGRRYRVAAVGTSFYSPPALLRVHSGAVLFVKANASGANDGSTWQNAFTNLQEAVAATDGCSSIWVAQGIYVPTATINGYKAFSLKSGVSIYGGFVGTEAALSDRTATNITVLQPAPGESTIFQNLGYQGSIDRSAILDGFTLSGASGYAVYNAQANPTIRNCRFVNNSGSAIVNDLESSPLLTGCCFSNNFKNAVVFGGGARGDVSDCIFAANTADSTGAAIQVLGNSQLIATRCEFRNNEAFAEGGAISLDDAYSSSITRCLFIANRSGSLGGAIKIKNTPVILENLELLQNASYRGGAISISGTNVVMRHLTVSGNQASQEGGGVYLASGDCTLENSILWNNQGFKQNSTVEEKQLVGEDGTTFSLSHCVVQGLDSYSGNGNLKYDPLFVSKADGTLGLAANSPAIDTGDSSLSTGILEDYAGSNRLFGASVDIGAVELQQAALTPVFLLSTASSTASACQGGDTQLSVVGSTNLTVTWQINTGSGFSDIVSSSNYLFTTTSTSSVLTVVNTTLPMTNHIIRYLISASSFTSAPISINLTPANIIYVNGTASGANNGSTWANAFTNLDQAITTATHCNEIWVARGNYTPQSGPWTMKSGLGIYGGFAGTETSRQERNWQPNSTVLTTTQNALIYNDGSIIGIDMTAVLDGFTISNLTALIAINNNRAAPTIRNCSFINNQGYSVYNDNSSPTLVNCSFTNNASTAVYNHGGAPVLTHCFFVGNQSQQGAAIRNVEANPGIEDCLFAQNAGTAIYNTDGSAPTVAHSVFRENTTTSDGGAIVSFNASNTTIRNSLFFHNNAFVHGGAIAHYEGTLSLLNCTFTENTASFSGGAIYNNSAAIACQNSILWDNHVTDSFSTDPTEMQQIVSSGGSVLIDHSAVQGLNVFTGNNNIGYDPLFIDPAIGNYQLLSNSPSINAGSTSGLTLPDTDLNGSNRVADVSVDIGAYEFQGIAGTSVPLFLLPRPKPTCVGGSVDFVAVATPGQTLKWEHWNGTNFESVIEGSDFHLQVDGLTNTLQVLNQSFANHTFRFTIPSVSFSSPDLTFQSAVRNVLYVKNGELGGNGSSWNDAYTSVSAALADADECTDIWIAGGLYRPSSTDPAASFHLKPNVRVFGGFAGNETSLEQRNWQANQTIFSGEIGASEDASDNIEVVVDAFGFSYHNGIPPNTLLDGVIIEDAQTHGVSVWQGSPTIRNCVLRRNGQGISLQHSSSLLENCFISGNGSAASVYGAGVDIISGTPILRGCTITNNTAGNNLGGGVYSSISTLRMENCVIAGNFAQTGAGISTYYDTNDVILNCTIVGNRSSVAPFVIDNTVLSPAPAGVFSDQSSVAIRNSIVWGNIAGGNSSEAGQLDHNTVGTLTVASSSVENLSKYAGNGNIASNPLFVNETQQNYRLLPCSLLIDAGDTNLLNGLSLDLDGQPRVASTNVDIGAYEFQGSRPATSIVINSEPADLSFCSGNQFYAGASGAGALNYQWFADANDGSGFVALTNDSIYTGVTTPTLTVSGPGAELNGRRFRCEISETSGCVALTRTATLTYNFRRWYVNVNRPSGPPSDGLSWETAYTDLGSTISAVNFARSVNGVCDGEIWVAAGDYYNFASPGFQPIAGFDIYGGFAGTETNLSQRVWQTNATILHGNLNTQAGDPANYLNNVIYFPSGYVRLDGLQFTGAKAGIYNSGDPLIVNCTFFGLVHGIQSSYGRPTISNCVFQNNFAYIDDFFGGATGGGIVQDGYGMTVENCVFKNNRAFRYGGAVYAQSYFDGETTSFKNCLFTGNFADINVGACQAASLPPSLGNFIFENCTFANNSANGSIGGLYSASFGPVQIYNSILSQNSGNQLLDHSSVNVYSSLVQGQTLTQAHANDVFSADPLFVSSTDFHLQSCSPAINRGNNNYALDLLTDLENQSRVSGGIIDLGPYEQPIFLAVTSQPQNQTSAVTAAIQFSVTANTNSATYRWQSSTNGTNFTDLVESSRYIGTTNSTLTVTNLLPAMDGFYFRARISDGCISTYSVAAQYRHLNTVPTALAQNISIDEDTSTNITLIAIDPDGTTPTVTLVSSPTNGTLTFVSGTTFSYLPNTNFNGQDRILFKASDAVSESSVSQITINVLPVNDRPVIISGKALTGTEDIPLPFSLEVIDVDHDPLTLVLVTPPAHGSITSIGTNLVYYPHTNFFGTDSFYFNFSDGTTTSAAPALVTINLAPVNDPPIAVDDVVNTYIGNTISIPVTANDSDPEGDTTLQLITLPSHGTASVVGTNVLYVHDGTMTSTDSFTYALTEAGGASSTGHVAINIDTNLSFVVTTANDNGPGSLRQAILNANRVVGLRAAITFSPSLASQTIIATNIGDTGFEGSAFSLSNSVSLDASAAPGLVLTRSTNVPMRFFRILTNADVILKDLQLHNGFARGNDGQPGSQGPGGGSGGGGGGAGFGGAIYNEGHVVLENISFTQNRAEGGHGGGFVTGDGLLGGNGGGLNGGHHTTDLNGGFGGGGAGSDSSSVNTFAGIPGFGGAYGAGGGGGNGGFGGGSGGGTGADLIGGDGLGAGGAIFNRGGYMMFTNCSFLTNSVNSISSSFAKAMAGAIFNYNGHIEFAASILDGNQSLECNDIYNLGDNALATVVLQKTGPTQDSTIYIKEIDLRQETINNGFTTTTADTASEVSPFPVGILSFDQTNRGPFSFDFVTYAPDGTPATAISLDPQLIASSNLTVIGTDFWRTVSVIPNLEASGPAKVQLSITNGNVTFNRIMSINVNRDFVADAGFRLETAIPIFSGNSTWSVVGTSSPAHGNVTFNNTNVFYKHNGSSSPTDQFQYVYTDGIGMATGLVQVVVGPGNQAPVTQNQSVMVVQNSSIPITLQATDAENNSLTYSISAVPLHGILSGSGTNYLYTPTNYFIGNDSFAFVANDGFGDSSPAIVSIVVQSTSITITSTNDSGPGSLRAAIATMNSQPVGNWTFIISNNLVGQEISLTNIGDTDFGPSAFLVLGNLVIDASAAPGFTLTRASTAPPMRLFRVNTNASLTLRNVALRSGYAGGGDGGNGEGGGGGGAGLGGAIFNQGILDLGNALFVENSAIGGAGGDYVVSGSGGNGGGDKGGTGGTVGSGTPGGFGGGGGGAGASSFAGLSGTAGFGGGSATVLSYAGGKFGGPGNFGGGAGAGSLGAGGGGLGAGGAIFNHGGTILVSNAVFVANTVRGGAGGNSTNGSAPAANGQGFGAAIFNLNGSVTLTNVDIYNNVGIAGAVYNLSTAIGVTSIKLREVLLNNPQSVPDIISTNSGGSMPYIELDQTTVTYPSTNFWLSTLPDLTVSQPGQITVPFTTGFQGPFSFQAQSDNQSVVNDNSFQFSFLGGQTHGFSFVATSPGTATISLTGLGISQITQTFHITVGPRRDFVVKTSSGQTVSIPVAQAPSETVSGFTPASLGTVNVTAGGKNLDYTPNPASFASSDSFAFTLSDGSQTIAGTVRVVITNFDLTVSSTANSGPGSLRDAVSVASRTFGNYHWRIGFTPALSGQTIALSSIGDTSSGPSAIKVRSRTIVDASSLSPIVITRDAGAPAMRLFKVEKEGDLTLQNISLNNGLAQGGNGADLGGAVYNRGIFRGNGLNFSSNGAGLGGAIFNEAGTLTLDSSVFTGNFASGETDTNGLVSGLNGQGLGAGIFNYNGTLYLNGLTMTGNTATNGIGLYNFGNGATASVKMTSVLMSNAGTGTNFVQSATTNGFASTIGDNLNVGTRSLPWIGDLTNLTVSANTVVPLPLSAPLGALSNYIVSATSSNPTLASVAVASNGSGGYNLNVTIGGNQVGSTTITVLLKDGRLTIGESFVLTVSGITLAGTDYITTFDNQTVQGINVLTNDTPGHGSTLTLLGFTGEGVTTNSDGTFNWTPPENPYLFLHDGEVMENELAFTYTVQDSNGSIAVGEVRATVYGVNEAPAVDTFTVYRQPNSTVKVNLSTLKDYYSFDPEADDYQFSVAPNSALGASVTAEDSFLVYHPLYGSNANNNDTITLFATDDFGAVSTNIISVVVTNSLLVYADTDTAPGCLRNVVDDANLSVNEHPWLIQFSSTLSNNTVNLFYVQVDQTMGRSSLQIENSMILDAGSTPVIIRRDPIANNGRLFRVMTNAELTLRNVILQGGTALGAVGKNGNGGGGGAAGLGGAILNQGSLILQSVIVRSNSATGGRGGSQLGSGLPGAGGIPFGGLGNGGAATGFGGGAGGNVGCVGSGGSGAGGGIFNLRGQVAIYNSSFSSNSAFNGVQGSGPVCTAINGVSYGGALFNYNGKVTIQNTTFTNNAAQFSSGIYNLGDGTTSTLYLNSVLITNNTANFDLFTASINGGASFFRGTNNQIGSRSGPWIGDIADIRQVNPPSNSIPVTFAVGLSTGDPTALSFSATSSDGSVIDNSALVLSGSGGSRTLTLAPSTWQRGRTVITVSAQENGNTAIEDFNLEIGLFSTLKVEGAQVALEFIGEAGHHYNVEYSPTLSPPAWTVIGTATESSSGQFEFHQATPTDPHGFYRLVEQP